MLLLPALPAPVRQQGCSSRGCGVGSGGVRARAAAGGAVSVSRRSCAFRPTLRVRAQRPRQPASWHRRVPARADSGNQTGPADAQQPGAAGQAGESNLMARLRAQAWLERVDSNGLWTVCSSLLAFGIFLLETMNEERFGGWVRSVARLTHAPPKHVSPCCFQDVLFRDDLPWYYGLSMSTISYAEGLTNTVFAAEFLLRAWIAGFSPSFFTNAFNLVDLASASPPLLALLGADARVLRLLRVCRVLRLLRLLDREPDSVLFGVLKSDDSGTQLLGVAAEFVCIFLIAAGVVYDLELGSNDNVHNLSDTLYWAFLTLTGIGQPFEIVTPAGKVATVIAVLVALITIPGQLAKLATVSMSQSVPNLMDYMTDEERDEFLASGGKVSVSTAQKAKEMQERARESQARVVGVGMGIGIGIGAMRNAAGNAASKVLAGPQRLAAPPMKLPVDLSPPPAQLAPGVDVNPSGGVKLGQGRRFRRTLVATRSCANQCELTVHDLDAAFCKNCGGMVVMEDEEGADLARAAIRSSVGL